MTRITSFPLRGLRYVLTGGAALILGLGVASASPAAKVANPWFRYILSSIPAGGYLTVLNTMDHAIRLTGAHSPACGMIMFHESVGGEMRPVESVTIPPHGSFEFAPGHYHMMCMHPHMKRGESVPVTLEFAGQPSVTADFIVYGARGPSGGK